LELENDSKITEKKIKINFTCKSIE
jgi:hypothetical protein